MLVVLDRVSCEETRFLERIALRGRLSPVLGSGVGASPPRGLW